MKKVFAYFAYMLAASCFAQGSTLATRAYCDHNVSVAANQAQQLFQTNIPYIVDQVTGNVSNEIVDIVSGMAITNVMSPYGEFASIFVTNHFSQGSFTNDLNSFGKPSIAFGINAVALGDNSRAYGYDVLALTQYSHAEGLSTIAANEAAHSEGSGTMASGPYSHAEGRGTKAYSTASHAEGIDTVASNTYAHAEGSATLSLGYGSHAEGANTIAYASGAHTEGYGTVAHGQRSHAEGQYTLTSNYFCHAEGNWCYALGHSSHAEGRATIANGNYSHADGVNSRTLSGDAYAYSWSGVLTASQVTNSAAVFYDSHGQGTYNINPRGGISGFYIAEQNLGTIISNIVHQITGQ